MDFMDCTRESTPHAGSIWLNPTVCPIANSTRRIEEMRYSSDAFMVLRRYHVPAVDASKRKSFLRRQQGARFGDDPGCELRVAYQRGASDGLGHRSRRLSHPI